MTTTTENAIEALKVLYYDNNNDNKSKANKYLQEYQQTVEAWGTSNNLLVTVDLPLELKLFAVQTFRSKIIYDLHQLQSDSLPSLRDTLMKSLINQPKVVLIYLCLSLSDLSLQFNDWLDPVNDMITNFSNTNPEILIEFLTVLPEEVNNVRIPINADQLSERSSILLTNHANNVIQLLSNYLINNVSKHSIFNCLKSWLSAGEISPLMLSSTPILTTLFESLLEFELFDISIDLLCTLIHETQEIQDNIDIIKVIVDHLSTLLPKLQIFIQNEDSDSVRNLCRLYSEAGETYLRLILSNPNEMNVIINSIALCSSYNDLDIVQITFNFWYNLSQSLKYKPELKPLFSSTYRQLNDVIINHLKFPDDLSSLTAEERDEFRSFRHYIGDTLKDCCDVIGSRQCLLRYIELVELGISSNKWQNVECSLFSMRSIGSKISIEEDGDIVENVFNLLNKLPNHPRIKYASILVAARFTQFINYKPDYIPFYLSFISSGFEANVNNDEDVDIAAAACQALSFVCEDCNRYLIDYLPQLHSFVQTLINNYKLHEDDLKSITTAISNVIEAIKPTVNQTNVIKQFVEPHLNIINQIMLKDLKLLNKDDLKILALNLESIENYITFTGPLTPLPDQCKIIPSETLNLLSNILLNLGDCYSIVERVCGLIRKGLRLFDINDIKTLLPPFINLIGETFCNYPLSAYVYLVSKCILLMDNNNQEDIKVTEENFIKLTLKISDLTSNKNINEISDIIEDYLHLLMVVIEFKPDLIINEKLINIIYKINLNALTLFSTEIIIVSLDFLLLLMGYIVGENVIHQDNINLLIITFNNEENYHSLLKLLIEGLVDSFSDDCVSTVITLIRQLGNLNPQLMSQSIQLTLSQSSLSTVSQYDKQTFLQNILTALEMKNLQSVRKSVHEFYKASKRSIDRANLIQND